MGGGTSIYHSMRPAASTAGMNERSSHERWLLTAGDGRGQVEKRSRRPTITANSMLENFGVENVDCSCSLEAVRRIFGLQAQAKT